MRHHTRSFRLAFHKSHSRQTRRVVVLQVQNRFRVGSLLAKHHEQPIPEQQTHSVRFLADATLTLQLAATLTLHLSVTLSLTNRRQDQQAVALQQLTATHQVRLNHCQHRKSVVRLEPIKD